MSYLEDRLVQKAISSKVSSEASISIYSDDYCTDVLDEKVYDLASLTKTICGYITVKFLQERNISLDEKISNFISVKTDITFRNLLTHDSGLRDQDFVGTDIFETLQEKYCLNKVNYADINYIILFQIVDTLTNAKTLVESFMKKNNINITYNPNKSDCVENQERINRKTIGVVHDTKCFNMGGVSYHAGLFSNINNLMDFYKIIIKDEDFLKTCEKGIERTSCFIKKSQEYDLNENVLFHTGYTGGSVLIDLKKKIIIVILTNRTIMKNFYYEKIRDFRNDVHKEIYKSLF